MAGLYASFGPDFWDKKEPLELRPPTEAIRHERMIKRLLPVISDPETHWLIARHIPTGEIMACACWVAPGKPVHNFLRRSAVDFYGWKDQYKFSDSELEEMWSHVDDEQWNGYFARCDTWREEILGDEPHWYLASLFTLPKWQGRGAAKLLLNWAIEPADANDPPTPLYLESSVMAMPVYVHCGFVKQNENNFLRRGPVVARDPKTETN